VVWTVKVDIDGGMGGMGGDGHCGGDETDERRNDRWREV
jgi:hypothetical protein